METVGVRLLIVLAAVAGAQAAGLNYAYGGAGWGVPTAPDYAGAGSGTCSTGRNQSPINLVSESSSTLVVTALPPLNLNYETTTAWTMAATLNYLEVEQIQTASANSAAGTAVSSANNGIVMDAYGYTMSGASAAGVYVPLNQFHFHSPSENTVDGMHYPLEMHMVHKQFAQPGNTSSALTVATVVAVMFKIDPSNADSLFFDQLLDGPLASTPFLTGAATDFDEDDGGDQFSMMNEVFNGVNGVGTSAYYAFNGSLTTPGCTEGLNWRVLATPLTISTDQLSAFLNALALRQGGNSRGGDNRDVQPLYARTVLASFNTTTFCPAAARASATSAAPRRLRAAAAATVAVAAAAAALTF